MQPAEAVTSPGRCAVRVLPVFLEWVCSPLPVLSIPQLETAERAPSDHKAEVMYSGQERDKTGARAPAPGQLAQLTEFSGRETGWHFASAIGTLVTWEETGA